MSAVWSRRKRKRLGVWPGRTFVAGGSVGGSDRVEWRACVIAAALGAGVVGVEGKELDRLAARVLEDLTDMLQVCRVGMKASDRTAYSCLPRRLHEGH